jgi:hypothetical protein
MRDDKVVTHTKRVRGTENASTETFVALSS